MPLHKGGLPCNAQQLKSKQYTKFKTLIQFQYQKKKNPKFTDLFHLLNKRETKQIISSKKIKNKSQEQEQDYFIGWNQNPNQNPKKNPGGLYSQILINQQNPKFTLTKKSC